MTKSFKENSMDIWAITANAMENNISQKEWEDIARTTTGISPDKASGKDKNKKRESSNDNR